MRFTTRLPGFAAGLSLIVPALVACSGGSGGVGRGGEPIPRDKVGAVMLDKICGAIKGCCDQNGFAEEHKTCTQLAATYQASVDEQLAKNPSLVYSAQRAGNCIAKWSAALGSCSPKTSGFDPGDDPDCENVLSGAKTAGATCENSEECADDGTCRRSAEQPTAPGVCVARKVAVPGDACYTPTDTLDPSKTYAECRDNGLYCEVASKTCKTAGGPGTRCMGDGTTGPISTYGGMEVCDASSYCDFNTKKCEARQGVGGSCAGASCADTAHCEQTSMTCVARKAPGEACGGTLSGGDTECLHGCDKQTKKCRSNGIAREVCAGRDFE